MPNGARRCQETDIRVVRGSINGLRISQLIFTNDAVLTDKNPTDLETIGKVYKP